MENKEKTFAGYNPDELDEKQLDEIDDLVYIRANHLDEGLDRKDDPIYSLYAKDSDMVDELDLKEYSFKTEDGEIIFTNSYRERRYFEDRLGRISDYSNEFFASMAKASLAKRYIKALAYLSQEKDEYLDQLATIYRDCLTELDVDSYTVDSEIDNYLQTHDGEYLDKKPMIVSGENSLWSAGKKK